MVSLIPQNMATVANLHLSLSSWLITHVKTPYDTKMAALGLSAGVKYDPQTQKYSSDSNGLSILKCKPNDQSLYQRSPTIGYCIDEEGRSKPPVSIGIGGGGQIEWHPVTIFAAPPVKIDSGGTVETDSYGHDVLKTYLLNGIGRTFVIPFLDLEQPSGSSYVQVSVAYIEGFRSSHLPQSLKESLIVAKDRFEMQFELKIYAQTTNG